MTMDHRFLSTEMPLAAFCVSCSLSRLPAHLSLVRDVELLRSSLKPESMASRWAQFFAALTAMRLSCVWFAPQPDYGSTCVAPAGSWRGRATGESGRPKKRKAGVFQPGLDRVQNELWAACALRAPSPKQGPGCIGSGSSLAADTTGDCQCRYRFQPCNQTTAV